MIFNFIVNNNYENKKNEWLFLTHRPPLGSLFDKFFKSKETSSASLTLVNSHVEDSTKSAGGVEISPDNREKEGEKNFDLGKKLDIVNKKLMQLEEVVNAQKQAPFFVGEIILPDYIRFYNPSTAIVLLIAYLNRLAHEVTRNPSQNYMTTQMLEDLIISQQDKDLNDFNVFIDCLEFLRLPTRQYFEIIESFFEGISGEEDVFVRLAVIKIFANDLKNKRFVWGDVQGPGYELFFKPNSSIFNSNELNKTGILNNREDSTIGLTIALLQGCDCAHEYIYDCIFNINKNCGHTIILGEYDKHWEKFSIRSDDGNLRLLENGETDLKHWTPRKRSVDKLFVFKNALVFNQQKVYLMPQIHVLTTLKYFVVCVSVDKPVYTSNGTITADKILTTESDFEPFIKELFPEFRARVRQSLDAVRQD